MRDDPFPCPECARLKARIAELEAEIGRWEAALRAAHLAAAIAAGQAEYRQAIEDSQPAAPAGAAEGEQP